MLLIILVIILSFVPFIFQYQDDKMADRERNATNRVTFLEKSKPEVKASQKSHKEKQKGSEGATAVSSGPNTTRTTNWTILLTVNNAFFDFYQNWLWHYRQLNLPTDVPVIVIAEDDDVFDKITALHTPGVTVKKSHMDPINSSLVFDTPLFKKYMARRAVYLLEYLEQGEDVLHVDVDSVWLKNPLPYLVGDFDILGQVETPANLICIGFIAFKGRSIVKNFVKLWIEKMELKTNKLSDQEVFNVLRRKRTDLKIKTLPIQQFPSGKLYFDKSDDVGRKKAVVVHNNWIIGHDTKKNRFKKFSLWKV